MLGELLAMDSLDLDVPGERLELSIREEVGFESTAYTNSAIPAIQNTLPLCIQFFTCVKESA